MNTTVGGELEVSWRAGATLARYRLVSRVAQGVRAEIWRAKITGAEGFEKPIALKTMRPSASRMPELVRMFTTEASIAAHLYHPNIVQLVDCGQIAGRYFMAMEFVDGLTLRQILQRLRGLGQPFPVRLLVHIGVQVCNALHYAHELFDADGWLGFLHRDLNPDNLMVAPTGATKIIDFGAARLASTPGPTYPFVGDVHYAAPERIRGLAEDRRGDIYSLGVMLYEAATGLPPYQRGEQDVVSRILQGRPRPPRELAPALPEALSAMILKAMRLAPADRYPSANQLAADLQAFVDDLPAAPDRTDAVPAALQMIFRETSREAPRERFAPDAYDSHEEETSPVALTPGPAAREQTIDVAATRALQPKPVAPEPLPDIFDRPHRTAHRTAFVATPFSGTAFAGDGGIGADVFSIRRGGASHVVRAAAPGDADAPPFVARNGRARERDNDEPQADSGQARAQPPSEAVRCFDRGLTYTAEKQYALAAVEWQRALELDPENRLYRSNLRRLQTQLAGRD